MKKKRLLTDKSGELSERYAEQAAKEMASEIDRQVLWGMLENLGWTRVIIPYNNNIHVNLWAAKNCKGAFEYHNRDYIFEDEKDANWFKLRWLS